MSLDPDLKRLATGQNFAALTTLLPDGQPQTHLMWVGATDEHLLINTQVGRRKQRNVEADPRVTVTVFNGENPYQYVEARGRVTATTRGDEAAAHIEELSQRYTGKPFTIPAGAERELWTIAVDRIHKNNL